MYQPLLDLIEGQTPEEASQLVKKLFAGKVRKSARNPALFSFGYRHMKTDFSHPAARLCRGLFLQYQADVRPNWRVMGCAFPKFFNYNEAPADVLDESQLRVTDKLDGSLIKFWWDDHQWQIGTNNTCYAQDAGLPGQEEASFYSVVMRVAEKIGFPPADWDRLLNPAYTYIFELIAPENRIVVAYQREALIHLATRHVATGQELDIYHPDDVLAQLEKPKRYPYTSIAECVARVRDQPEGFVVSDAAGKRVKIKSPDYIALHYQMSLSERRVWSCPDVLIGLGQQTLDDYLSLFPDHQEETTQIVDWFHRTEKLVLSTRTTYPTKALFLKAHLLKYPPPTHTTLFFSLMVALYQRWNKEPHYTVHQLIDFWLKRPDDIGKSVTN